MPSKGIQVYSYNSVPSCQIEFSVPKQTISLSNQKEFTTNHLEVDKKNLPGFFNFSGIFRFRVTKDGAEVINRWVQINTLTGNLEGGNMRDMTDQTSVIANDVIVTYLFYDSDNYGTAGLPKYDQCYVTVTPNYSQWMSTVAVQGSPYASKPFTSFVLPAAHDIGMNSMQHAEAILGNASAIFLGILKANFAVFAEIGRQTVDQVLVGLAGPIMQGLAITQKDSLSTILSTGARYFEFRPAYLHSALRAVKPIPDVLYFQHGPITGMSYEEFLYGCVDFLLKNPGEIIVVQLRWDGVPKECARPSDQDLQSYLDRALKPAFGGLLPGSLNDMRSSSIDGLRVAKKRLIMLKDVDSFSTYDDKANATLNGDTIIAQFERMTAANQQGKTFTNLQCQATATNIPRVVAFSSLTANVSNSCLLATKAICDNRTMPWIQKNALAKLGSSNLIVVMDDFVDGGMCDVARDLTMTRLSQT